jgi:hypothetical protein
MNFPEFQPDPSSVMDSTIFRKRTAPAWWQFLTRAWKGRRRDEQAEE